MKSKLLSILLAILIICPTVSFAKNKNKENLPKICVIATGGTIAGSGSTSVTTAYKPGVLKVEDILAAVPDVSKIAEIEAVQFSNIASQNMSNEMMAKISNFLNELLAREDITGAVITHGTDTMEETAYFMSLTVNSPKPVILVGSMRPSTAVSADGPANLYAAISTAINPASRNRGAMVVMNDNIFTARDVTKANTLNTNAFMAPNTDKIGIISNGKAVFLQTENRNPVFDIKKLPLDFPKVAILYGHPEAEAKLVDFLVEQGYKGIVYAGMGHGNMNDKTFEALINASNKGVAIVRAAKVYSGPVTSEGEVDDSKYGFASSGVLNPSKARILLTLSLDKAKGNREKAIEIFNKMKF